MLFENRGLSNAYDHEMSTLLAIARGEWLRDESKVPLADVAVADGKIVAVAPNLQIVAKETVDAAGLLVTPGFVDIHTHYDGQVTWDEALEKLAGARLDHEKEVEGRELEGRGSEGLIGINLI